MTIVSQALLEVNRKKVKLFNEALKCRQDRSLEATLDFPLKEKRVSVTSARQTAGSAPGTPRPVAPASCHQHDWEVVVPSGIRDNGDVDKKCRKCGLRG